MLEDDLLEPEQELGAERPAPGKAPASKGAKKVGSAKEDHDLSPAATGADYSAIIRDYWRERGYAVSCGARVVAERGRKGAIRYVAVRSDMVSGLPRDYRGDRAISLKEERVLDGDPGASC